MSLRNFVIQSSPRDFWLATGLTVIAAAVCFYLIFRWLHRARLIADTPTAYIRSAAQGYVELQGWASMMDGAPIHAPLSGLACVWYSYRVEQKTDDNDRWRTIENGVSEAIFHLDDGTGLCIVDPEGADITPSVRLCWRGLLRRPGAAPSSTGFRDSLLSSKPYRYTECRIQDGDPLYAIGQFVALGTADTATMNEEIRDLLSRWKQNRPELLRRFDTDRDGEIGSQEWEEVRRQAEREVMASWHEKTQHAELPLLRKPEHGRPYLLSTVPQETLTTRYRRNAGLAILGFLLLGSGAAWALGLRFGALF
jgi:hypothetical protein